MPYKPKEIARVIARHGFVLTRQKGSHARFKHPDGRAVTIPLHAREMPIGTFRAIVRESEIPEEEF